jgi:hypothetical protein
MAALEGPAVAATIVHRDNAMVSLANKKLLVAQYEIAQGPHMNVCLHHHVLRCSYTGATADARHTPSHMIAHDACRDGIHR